MSKQNSHGRVTNSGSRAKNDTYLTPPGLVMAGLQQLNGADFNSNLHTKGIYVADFGAGTGVWGACVRKLSGGEHAYIVGYELDMAYEKPDWYDDYIYGDVRETVKGEFDLVIMNPPFNLISDFIRKAVSVLKNGGYILCLAPLSFIMPKKERRDLVDRPYCPEIVYLLDPRPSYYWLYTDKKTTDVEDAVLLLYKKSFFGYFPKGFYNTPLYWTYEADYGVTEALRKHPNMQVYKEIYETSRRRIE